MTNCNTIMAILINHRSKHAPNVQEVLTKHGCIIRVRVGMHEVDACTEEGLIILQLCGSGEDITNLQRELEAFDNVRVKTMSLT